MPGAVRNPREPVPRVATATRRAHIPAPHDISPAENTQLLYDFLREQGVEQVEMQKADFFTLGISEHISGAAAFLTIVGRWLRDKDPLQ